MRDHTIGDEIASFKAFVDCIHLTGANPSSRDLDAAIDLVTTHAALRRAIRAIHNLAGTIIWEHPVSTGCSAVTIFGSTIKAEQIIYITRDVRLEANSQDRKSFWRVRWNDERLHSEACDISQHEHATLIDALAAAAAMIEKDGARLTSAAA